MKKQWYYPIQEHVKAWLNDVYEAHYLNWQEVTKNRVYENYLVTTKEGVSGGIVMVVMLKQSKTYQVYHHENNAYL